MFALPAAASAVAAAAPAVAATAAKATIMTTLKSVAFNALTNLAISAALSVFTPTVGAAARTVEFVIDPDGPIPFAAGHIGVPGAMAHKDTFGPDLMYYGIPVILSGAGPITAIQSVKADDYPMAFDANGGATTEPYRQEFFFRSVLGHQPAPAALSLPNGLKGGGRQFAWSAAHKLSGKAAFLMVMAENSKGSAFPNGEVKPLVELLGLKGWDPTLDSTYPGGTGPCRLHDASTWVTLTCPILWALKWALGLWEGPTLKGAPAHDSTTDHQVGGIGARLSGIDVPAFVAASNIAKANNWTVSAYPNTDDDKHQVLETFLQAGGAIYSQRAGKISCISRAAPRASLVTISAADTAGPLEIDTAASRIDRINTIRPRFWSPAHRWQMTALDGEVTAASYREEDGGRTRSRGVDWPFVSDAKQVGQLAALQIANTREGIAGVIPLKPHLQRIRPGDAFTITEAGFVLNGLKCLCLNTEYDPATGVVRVSFVSETDGKYPFALGQNPNPPAPQVLEPVDPRHVSPPLPGDWVITPRPPSGDGTQQPGFDLTGLVSNATATAVIVEWGAPPDPPPPDPLPEDKTFADYVDWEVAYQGPPDVQRIPITGLQSGQTYYIAVRYQRNQNYSARYVYGPYEAPTLTSGVSDETIETIISDVLDQVDTDIGEGIQAGRDALARVRDNALLILQNAKNALDGTLKEEEGRKTQTDDLQDRIDIGFLIDPIAKTGIIRSQVKVEGLNETFVQINTRLVARDAENALQTAQVALDAQAYTNDKVSVATANLVTAAQMNTAISGAVLSMRSYADDKVATATAGLVAVAQMNAAIASSALSLQSYTNSKVSEATAGLATSASVAAAIASSDLALRSYTDGQISTATANLISAAGVDTKIATASLALSSQTDSKIATATANLISAAQLATALAGSELSLKGYTDGQISTATALLASKAEVFANQNLMPNGSGELGLTGWAGPVGLETILWQPYGGQILKQPIPGAASDWYVNGPQAKVSGQGTVTLSWRGGREGGYAGTATVFLIFRNAQGGTVGETPRKDIGTLDPGKFVTASVPGGAATAQLGIHINGTGGSGQSIWISRVKIENGAVVTPYTLDGTAFSLAATAAIQADAIADAETKLSQARLRLVSAAVGGNPAVVELYSDNDGPGSNFVRISAAQIMLGANTTFDTANSVWRTTAPGGLVRVFAFGSPFGANGDLLEWWGPVGTAIGSMTTGNGYNGRMTTAPYVFDNTQASSFKAVTNTGFIGGGRVGAGPVQTSNTVSVTVTGGTGTATIRWVRVSGDSRINMNDPTGFTTGAYATIGVGEVISAYFMGAVTKGGQSAVVYVQVDLSDNGT